VNSEFSCHLCRSLSKTLVAAAVCLSLSCSGCGYPEVSPKTYELAKALYSATNLEQLERLDVVEEMVGHAMERQEITSREADYLVNIINRAREGDWKQAQQQARRLMVDQVGTSPSKSNPHSHSPRFKSSPPP